jgi:glycosyltransferase involved in cell wall biosynthesis
MVTARIAFVIPAYQAAAVVERAIASARAQSAPADAIIVVDDGSRDETAALAEASGARVICQMNGGPAAARNTGIQATRAEWIALLDADDISRPGRLELERPHLGDPRVALVAGLSAREDRTSAVPPGEIDFDTLWLRNWIPTSTVLLRKAAWEAVGGFDETRDLIGVEDYNLWLRLAHAGWRFTILPEPLVDYRPTPQSLTAQTRRFAEAELVNVRRIAEQLSIPAAALRDREFKIYREYGLELFYYGEMASAREFLREAAHRGKLDLRTRLRLLAAAFPLRRSPAR